MKTKIITLLCLSLLCLTIYAEKMTFTTNRAIGSTLDIEINADEADQADIWIDLNNNGEKDADEAVSFGEATYVIDSQTISIYGRVAHFLCSSSGVQSLDVTGNPTLQILGCNWSSLNTLDLSQNVNLKQLYASRAKLSSIDLSHNTKLTMVYLDGNQLTGLDITKNTALQRLVIAENNITDENMTFLIQSLADRNAVSSGKLNIIAKVNDNNVVYRQHILDANAKNWDVYYKNETVPLLPDDFETSTLNNEMEIRQCYVPTVITDYLHIQKSDDYIVDHISIIDLSGKVVKSKQFSSQETISMDLSQLEDGLYLIRINRENGVYKVLKK